MQIKSVVKVMNFHALLRVDKARKEAEKYRQFEEKLTDMMTLILNNRNFILDRKVNTPDKSKPPLTVYIGSDLGFCGSVNSSVSRQMRNDPNEKILLGKKIGAAGKVGVLCKFNREDYESHALEILELLKKAVINREYSSVSVVYNRYYNISKIALETKQIYPLEFKLEKTNDRKTQNDYLIESRDGNLLENMIIQYLEYEIRICWLNSFASENVLRQSSTSDSLKKIDEIEEEELKVERKARKMKSFKKVLDTFNNTKQTGEN